MRTVVNIGGHSDLTGREYVFEKEVIVEEGTNLQEAVVRLIDQLNQENTLILYYILNDKEESNQQKPGSLSGCKRIVDKGDSL